MYKIDNCTPKQKFESLQQGNIELPPDGRETLQVQKEASTSSSSSKTGPRAPKRRNMPDDVAFGSVQVASTSSKNTPEEAQKPKKTIKQQLFEIINRFHYFKNPSGVGWVKAGGKCYTVKGKIFKRLVQHTFHKKHGKTPYAEALKDVLHQAEAKALFEGPTEKVWPRVAAKDDKIIINRYEGKILISPSEWGPGSSPSVNFCEPAGLSKLPLPKKSTDGIERLRKFLNFESEDDFRLMIAWILGAYNPEIPCPILTIQGEQGSAKSTTAKVLRSLIDPSGAMMNPAPSKEKDLIIQAQYSHVLVFDNISGLKKWLSDALCRICTGTGFRTRELYTDDGQQIFQVQRPIILNGIDDIATRGDLLDRSIVINLPSIPANERKDEREFWKEFKKAQPYILAALYDALAAGLAADRPHLKELPRMADFAEWITRCEEGLSWDGELLDAYNKNQDNAIETGLDGDYLASAVRNILSKDPHYEGTATDIVKLVREVSPESSLKYLPTTRTLKGKLTRLAPALRKIGIYWEYNPNGNKRTYFLRKVEEETESIPF